MTNKFVNLNVFPNQIILNDPQGVDVEDRQLSTGALVWHIKIPQQNQVHINKLQNTTISESTLSTSVVTPSEYVEVTSDAVENAGYGLSIDAQQKQAAIYVATHINKTNNSDTNNTNGSSDIDRLYALDARTGHILWQRDPSTLYRDVQSDQPDPTPQPTVKAILHPTHGIHDFTNFVGTWNSHNGYLLFKANGDAQLYIKPQGCQGGPGCEEKNAITGIHFNRAEGNKAFGDVTTASSDYKTGTTIVATLQDNDTLSIDKVGFDFCGPKSPPGYYGA